jgi:hypothetical protein
MTANVSCGMAPSAVLPGADGSTAIYESMLSLLDGIPWGLAPEVTDVRPLERENIDFFPGHRGYLGAEFPSGGIMVVGNNFSSLKGWSDYRNSPDVESPTRTWRNLKAVIEASGIQMSRFWFTNYCMGAMDQTAESYDFPTRTVRKLEFARVFEGCVSLMRPALIVTLGRLASARVGTDFANRKRIDVRDVGGHETRLIALVHPSAWTWQGRGFTADDLRTEGARIATALSETQTA